MLKLFLKVYFIMSRYIPQSKKMMTTNSKVVFAGKSIKLPKDLKEINREKFKNILKDKMKSK